MSTTGVSEILTDICFKRRFPQQFQTVLLQTCSACVLDSDAVAFRRLSVCSRTCQEILPAAVFFVYGTTHLGLADESLRQTVK